ncbi:C-terminal binding protein [Leucobacter chromiireducens]|uniref:C-terminal binding protein n=1 Tax=Leucobacter chromiireducens subsp. chromiireducens TaxID=660067 RepID=A0ABS1SM46_9MICO|nr:C-terminal binding protein [Leucobacter chromiireducens]MBL3688564.1 C-terminal binding protein [Leucobacter chromiireducens subsp. chromiireducens]
MNSDLVLLTDSDLPGTAARDTLAAAGLTAQAAQTRDPEQLIAAGKDATALVVQWAPITAEVMDGMPNLRIISRLGIGVDMVDLAAATERGIAVANTPTYCVEEVATHTLAMILAQARGLAGYDAAVRAGRWAAVDAQPMSIRPSASTVGVIGYGRIGRMVASSLIAMGFRVLVSDPFLDADAARAAGVVPATLDEALSGADIVTLHAPLTDETRHMLNAQSIARMRQGAVVVNTCRGPLIDEDALADAIESGHLGGAALDVFAAEPLPADSRLRANERVLLTPHAAWYSPEALADLPVHAAQNVVEFLAGRPVPAILNPEALTRREEVGA